MVSQVSLIEDVLGTLPDRENIHRLGLRVIGEGGNNYQHVSVGLHSSQVNKNIHFLNLIGFAAMGTNGVYAGFLPQEGVAP